ncbi:MAG: hypothetical protein K2X60_12475 [Xanthobacteraceae bacterium]|nr:hypothetical protein [Xanthobacteraceae bacterium]
MQQGDSAPYAEAMGTASRKSAKRLKLSLSDQAAKSARKAALKRQRKVLKPG